MNDNECYLMLNGKKITLTDEQVKLIQADEPKKSPFDRAEEGDAYYFIGSDLGVYSDGDTGLSVDNNRLNAANYCTNKYIMHQHALHMLLNNLLWRYSMTHGGDKIG